MSLEITVGKADKKATVVFAFTAEVDLEHAMRTEKLQFLDIVRKDQTLARFRAADRKLALEWLASDPQYAGAELVDVDEGERQVVSDDAVLTHALSQAHEAFGRAVAAYHFNEDQVAQKRAELEEEIESHKSHRPTVRMHKP